MTLVRKCGDRALLLEVDDVHGMVRALEALDLPGVTEIVAGARTVLVSHGADADVNALARRVAGITPMAEPEGDPATITLEVIYDGDDLGVVAGVAGISVEEVIARHVGADYQVAFCGFSPGFAYLKGLDPSLVVPRLASPRTRVPAGSVAIADTWSAVYPRESPGGWRLLGHTRTPLWDLTSPVPALLTPGTRVRFARIAS